MCQKCGCNTCETDSTALMLNESKAPRTILSEGLKHHIDNNKPLTEHLYRAGSSAYFNLIAEARSLYSRGILEFTNEDDLGLLNETDLGHFGMFEGKKVPLDFPIELNEQMDIYDDIANMEFGMDYDQLGSNEKEWVRDEIDNMEMRESLNEDIYDKFLDNPSSPKGRAKSLILKFTKEYGDDASSMAVDRFASKNNLKPEEKYILKYITKNDIKISSQPGGPDFSALNESQAIITFKNDYEVKMNTGEGYDDDFEYFKAGEREQVYILDKNDKRVHVEFGDGTNAYIPKDVISIQEKSLVKNRINEAVKKALTEKKSKKKEKKDPPLNKPKRGGSKAYYVYVRDPKTKKIKKVSFGSGGLRAKIKNKEARNAFAARHNCKNKKDRTKAGYWSCNLPRYAEALGLGAKMNTFW